MPDTVNVAKPIDADGELYQRRALAALPILVRQAGAGQTIVYGALAAELGMENPRNLNFVLGAVGTSLVNLSRDWGAEIPPLQALVVNKLTRRPGEGFVNALSDPEAYRAASPRLKAQIISGLLADVFRFTRWRDVLRHFSLEPIAPPQLEAMLPAVMATAFANAGESSMHREFKEYVADHAHLVGVQQATVRIEHSFPSGDTVDVLFETSGTVVAVETKSQISPDEDVLRGVFQCVKYLALVEATLSLANDSREARSVLVLESRIPASVLPIANTLGIEIVDAVRPSSGAI